MKNGNAREKLDTIPAKKTPRIPKLPKTRLVELFIRSGIPFLNCPENEIVQKGIALLEDIQDASSSNENFAVWIHFKKEAQTWNTNKTAGKLFLETRVLIKELVNRAVNEVKIPKDDDLLDKVKEILKPLSITVSTIKDEKGGWIPLTQWYIPSLKKYYNEHYEPMEYTNVMVTKRGAAALIVAFTIETFRGFIKPRTEKISSFGKDWIGICPRSKCENAYEKQTQRQKFCSNSCQEALKQERHREKNK